MHGNMSELHDDGATKSGTMRDLASMGDFRSSPVHPAIFFLKGEKLGHSSCPHIGNIGLKNQSN